MEEVLESIKREALNLKLKELDEKCGIAKGKYHKVIKNFAI